MARRTGINDTLQGNFQGPVNEVANAKTDKVVLLCVPHQYRLNMQRYLRVAVIRRATPGYQRSLRRLLGRGFARS